MLEADDRQDASQAGDRDASDTPQQAAEGGEETNPAKGTPPISGSDQRADQTEVPSPEDDVGVPDELEDRTE